ncbi:MAG TPA: hypothetical protein VMW10_07530 [Alphaproteobacteria bacterium]|nr:hypothetical protein [Alphaproteobacteria bacterium]
MLKVIEPQYHNKDKPTIDSFLGLLKIYQKFYLSPETQDKATFLIAEDDKRGIYGGAVVYSQNISSSLKLAANDTDEACLGKMFSAFQPKGQEYWTARILCLGELDTSLPILETASLYENFYKDLYICFTNFGEKEEIEYLPFTLQSTEACFHNTFGLLPYKEWPYLIEVKLSDNSDGFFHGILSLKGNKFRLRKQGRISKGITPFPQTMTVLKGGLS